MKYPQTTYENPQMAEVEEGRSRFICRVMRCENLERGREYARRIAESMPGSRHNPWAYYKNGNERGYSDDGEPSGSAGPALLQQIEASGLSEILCVVTRYYGGRKLGIGNLRRAYVSALKKSLKDLPAEEGAFAVQIITIHENYGRIEKILKQFNLNSKRKFIYNKWEFEMLVPMSEYAELEKRVLETGGSIKISTL